MLAERTGTARQLTLRSAACNNYYYLGRWDDVLVEMDVLLELLEEGAVAAYEHMHIHGYGALVAAHRDDRATLDGHVSAVRDRLSEPRLVRNTHNLREALALAAEQDGRLEDVFLSPRTVQSHVSHILTKLDARSRVEIGRAVARH